MRANRQRIILVFCLLSGFSAAGPLGNGSDRQNEEDSTFTDDVEDYIVNFMLFTRKHPNTFYLLQVENKLSISKSTFDPNKDTKIIIHGWKNAYNSNFSVIVREAYLKKYDANIINVDWSDQSHQNYVSSRLDVEKVAVVVAKMIDLLVDDFGMQSSRVHIVGHSLGAHVAGIAGLTLTTGNVSRITGLDPAMPLFTVYESQRLRSDSADFVDVIHTCGNLLGFESPLGQVDFYPNGGTFEQPGCGFDYKGKCSHARSYLYFAESVASTQFLAVSCGDWQSFTARNCSPSSAISMGEHVPSTARGSYFLRTHQQAPFMIGSDVFFPLTTTSSYPDDYGYDYGYGPGLNY